MKSRPLRLVTRLAIAASLPVLLLGVGAAGGYADATGEPSPAPSSPPVPSQPPPDKEPVIVNPQGTKAFEKTGCRPSNPTVTVSRPVDVPVTVVVETTNGTAVAPDDYLPIKRQKVVIPPGSLSAEIPITIVNDGVAEPDEYFNIKISSPSVGHIGKDTAVVVIADGTQPTPCEKG